MALLRTRRVVALYCYCFCVVKARAAAAAVDGPEHQTALKNFRTQLSTLLTEEGPQPLDRILPAYRRKWGSQDQLRLPQPQAPRPAYNATHLGEIELCRIDKPSPSESPWLVCLLRS